MGKGYGEVHLLNEHVAVGGNDGDIFELDVLGLEELPLCKILEVLGGLHLVSLVDALLEIFEHVLHLVNEVGIPCHILDLLVGNGEPSNCLKVKNIFVPLTC